MSMPKGDKVRYPERCITKTGFFPRTRTVNESKPECIEKCKCACKWKTVLFNSRSMSRVAENPATYKRTRNFMIIFIKHPTLHGFNSGG